MPAGERTLETSARGGERTWLLVVSSEKWRLQPLSYAKVLNVIFGEKPSSSEVALHQAARLPRPVEWAIDASRLALVLLLGMAVFGLKDRIPIIGPWMAEAWWHLHVVWGALLSISVISQWLVDHRVRRLRRIAAGKDQDAN